MRITICLQQIPTVLEKQKWGSRWRRKSVFIHLFLVIIEKDSFLTINKTKYPSSPLEKTSILVEYVLSVTEIWTIDFFFPLIDWADFSAVVHGSDEDLCCLEYLLYNKNMIVTLNIVWNPRLFMQKKSIYSLNTNRSVSGWLPKTHKPPGQLWQKINTVDWNWWISIRFLPPSAALLLKYLFSFVGEANPMLYLLFFTSCYYWSPPPMGVGGGSISITAFHYMEDDSRAECASSMQPRIEGIIKLIVTQIDLDNEGRCTLKYNGHLL